MTEPVDLTKIRVGDEVTVRATVTVPEPDAQGDLEGVSGAGPAGQCVTYFKPDAIVSHTPKGLAVGDRVTERCGGPVRTIIAMDGDEAWTLTEGAVNRVTMHLSNLERVP